MTIKRPSPAKQPARPAPAVASAAKAVIARTAQSLHISPPERLLQEAARTIAQRGQERDTSGTGHKQERSMAATVVAFNAIDGTTLTERQGWAFMQALKLVRAASTARNGRYNPDDYVDGAAYAALGGECAAAQGTAA